MNSTYANGNRKFPLGSVVISQNAVFPNKNDFLLPQKPITYLTALQVIASFLAIAIQIFLVDKGDSDVNSIGTGIWCGIIFMLPYVFGQIGVTKPSKACVIAFLVFSILSACLCIPLAILSTFGAINNNNINNSYGGYSDSLLPMYTDSPLRLVGGRNSSEGNVFAYNPKTKIDGPVCDDGWDLDDAKYVCKHLGFGSLIEAKTNSYFGEVPSIFSYDDVDCQGYETTFDECKHLNNDNCDSDEGAGVVCGPRALWLEGGDNPESGNVFARNPSTKVDGPVCSNLWTSTNADIVCRQLGYPGAISHYSGSYFGQVPDTHSYASVNCFGRETILDECIHSNYPTSCGTSDGAGVYCATYSTTTITKTPQTATTSLSFCMNIALIVIAILVFPLATASSVLSIKVLCSSAKNTKQGFVTSPPDAMATIQSVPVPLNQRPYSGMQFRNFSELPPVYESIDRTLSRKEGAKPRF